MEIKGNFKKPSLSASTNGLSVVKCLGLSGLFFVIHYSNNTPALIASTVTSEIVYIVLSKILNKSNYLDVLIFNGVKMRSES
jgi:hypothetical protein